MVNFLKALILLPVAILVVLLAVANRGPVTVSLDPFSREAPEIAFTLPLFALIFLAVMLGVVIGGGGAAPRPGRHRVGDDPGHGLVAFLTRPSSGDARRLRRRDRPRPHVSGPRRCARRCFPR